MYFPFQLCYRCCCHGQTVIVLTLWHIVSSPLTVLLPQFNLSLTFSIFSMLCYACCLFISPFVMTTQDELQEAMYEYRRGTFLKHRFPGDYKRQSEIDRVRAKAKDEEQLRLEKEKAEREQPKGTADVSQTNCAVDAP